MEELKLITIGKTMAENARFEKDPNCKETLKNTLVYFDGLGYEPPWIAYYALINNEVVGTCAFKGPPKSNKVEVAYVTFEP